MSSLHTIERRQKHGHQEWSTWEGKLTLLKYTWIQASPDRWVIKMLQKQKQHHCLLLLCSEAAKKKKWHDTGHWSSFETAHLNCYWNPFYCEGTRTRSVMYVCIAAHLCVCVCTKISSCSCVYQQAVGIYISTSRQLRPPLIHTVPVSQMLMMLEPSPLTGYHSSTCIFSIFHISSYTLPMIRFFFSPHTSHPNKSMVYKAKHGAIHPSETGLSCVSMADLPCHTPALHLSWNEIVACLRWLCTIFSRKNLWTRGGSKVMLG